MNEGMRIPPLDGSNAPRAIGTDAATQEKRDELHRYVRRLMTGGPTNPRELARLVNAAPAQFTLTLDQWWNVALLLAQEIDRG